MAGGQVAGWIPRRVGPFSVAGVTPRDGLDGPVVWGLGIIVSVFMSVAVASTTVATDGAVASNALAVAGTVVLPTVTVLAGKALGTITAATFMVSQDALATPIGFLNLTLLRPIAPATVPADPATLAGDAPAILGKVMTTTDLSNAERD